jgi:hypothetical protein
MTQQTTDTSLEVVVDVDLDKPVACEHPEHETSSTHSGHGSLLVVGKGCPHCGWGNRGLFILCQSAWVSGGTVGLACRGCWRHVRREEAWTFVGEL